VLLRPSVAPGSRAGAVLPPYTAATSRAKAPVRQAAKAICQGHRLGHQCRVEGQEVRLVASANKDYRNRAMGLLTPCQPPTPAPIAPAAAKCSALPVTAGLAITRPWLFVFDGNACSIKRRLQLSNSDSNYKYRMKRKQLATKYSFELLNARIHSRNRIHGSILFVLRDGLSIIVK
jgi:hypothetical protein